MLENDDDGETKTDDIDDEMHHIMVYFVINIIKKIMKLIGVVIHECHIIHNIHYYLVNQMIMHFLKDFSN